MVAEPIESVLNREFLDKAEQELKSSGFVTDEHSFAPYRETIAQYVEEISRALDGKFNLRKGFVGNDPNAGYAHFIYDAHRYPNPHDAEVAVREWLGRKYADEDEA